MTEVRNQRSGIRSQQSEVRTRKTVSSMLFALSSVAALLFALSIHAAAQHPAKLTKIGWLRSGSSSAPGRELFQRELRELGYVEGKNTLFEYQFADNELDRLPALAEELVRLKVDVLVTSTTNAALAAKNITATIPIVFLEVSDPVGGGLVDSLARPGGNITGITNIAAALAGKRLEVLKETLPKLSRVAVLWNPQISSSAEQWKESELSARELGLQLHSMQVSSAEKHEAAFKEAIKKRSTALAVTLNPLAFSNQKLIADLARKNRLPAIYPRRIFARTEG
jgi:putative ABC transport system substrate-binding protein